jgi:hypothetical protein
MNFLPFATLVVAGPTFLPVAGNHQDSSCKGNAHFVPQNAAVYNSGWSTPLWLDLQHADARPNMNKLIFPLRIYVSSSPHSKPLDPSLYLHS